MCVCPSVLVSSTRDSSLIGLIVCVCVSELEGYSVCVCVCVSVLVSSTRDSSLIGLIVGWASNTQGNKSGNPLIATV